MSEEISLEIINYLRDHYSEGPSFEKLRKHLNHKFELQGLTKFFIQLEVVFRESMTEGFSGVLYSSSETSTSH
jgi:hypothetical protein